MELTCPSGMTGQHNDEAAKHITLLVDLIFSVHCPIGIAITQMMMALHNIQWQKQKEKNRVCRRDAYRST